MAASISSQSSAWTIQQNADINVTPFVDVMLVLLIIFMVALPVSTVSVKVDLPQAQAAAMTAQAPVIVTLTLAGRVYVGEKPVSLEDLPARVAAGAGANPTEQRIYLRADEGVRYGALMGVMNRLRANGFAKVGLVGEEF
ncbi:MAG: biopolymer transporter ExbD [Alphaproteobacteria bacterium]|nr:biopolymer transporter ExbD [Alphaproteobacteria bacterium]MBU1517234.1 biopolymer transporter ExbD [Alphaproteobacteria bacterium]MBU2093230.1 biopolymer transporter ExbD [Alphaproteobacteria bacterium]MBU2153144.1 biopolymer transporter ExbD [Alphaproteobacteria bacterium]MBU2307850.1 biopolymer transporter ExbD [Alphaproteobacteria bacterium]